MDDRKRSAADAALGVSVWLTLLVVVGCATQRQDPYAELINRPMPSSEQERTRECAWIRSEIARQQSLAQIGSTTATTPMMAVAFQSVARRHIAELESRYSQIQCDVIRVAPTAPVMSQPPPAPPPVERMSVDECFKKCRELTSQTEAQCFEECRH